VYAFLLRIRGQEEIHACRGAQHRTVVANTAHQLRRHCTLQALLQAGNESEFAEFANQHDSMRS
jgi:hypothetical protein